MSTWVLLLREERDSHRAECHLAARRTLHYLGMRTGQSDSERERWPCSPRNTDSRGETSEPSGPSGRLLFDDSQLSSHLTTGDDISAPAENISCLTKITPLAAYQLTMEGQTQNKRTENHVKRVSCRANSLTNLSVISLILLISFTPPAWAGDISCQGIRYTYFNKGLDTSQIPPVPQQGKINFGLIIPEAQCNVVTSLCRQLIHRQADKYFSCHKEIFSKLFFLFTNFYLVWKYSLEECVH